jgi:N-acyl-D-aspartate/D-glutamate deacylase
MDYDIVIRGGHIIDGTGAPPIQADLAIKDGLIAAIGTIEGSGTREIDASGKVVTPGFIDIHTHLDAQIGWDPDMTPVSWHGVTTALIGNCGMTFAPCKADDQPLLAGMMETVEDIPRDAILGGLAWDWEHYDEYLDSIDRLGTAINVAGLIGHAAVRYYVMGDRSFADQATPEELDQMAGIVARALENGAFGFSTNRFEPHKAPDGRSIPGTFADVSELERITDEVASRGGLMQLVGADGACLEAVGDKANARVLFSYGNSGEPGAGRAAAEYLDALCEGRDVTAISHVRGSGYLWGLQSGLPFRGETWRELYELDFDDRLAAIQDEAFSKRLIAESKDPKCSRVPIDRCYFLGAGETPDYTTTESLADQAEVAGEHWSETFLRLSRETEGRALFNFRMFSTNIEEQAELFKSSHIYPGLGDAGAHVSQIMDAGWSSFLLSYWTRERGEFSLPEVIEKMTSGPARVVGLRDRGILAEGMRADVNVFDPETVSEHQPMLVRDFPNEAPRYIQRANGFKATIVNGQLSLLDGELTGTRAGRVLRHSAA